MTGYTLKDVIKTVRPYLGENARFELYMTLLPDLNPGELGYVIDRLLYRDSQLRNAVERTYPQVYLESIGPSEKEIEDELD